LVWGVAGAATVTAVVREGVEFCREAISEAAPGIEAFECGVSEGGVQREAVERFVSVAAAPARIGDGGGR